MNLRDFLFPYAEPLSDAENKAQNEGLANDIAAIESAKFNNDPARALAEAQRVADLVGDNVTHFIVGHLISRRSRGAGPSYHRVPGGDLGGTSWSGPDLVETARPERGHDLLGGCGIPRVPNIAGFGLRAGRGRRDRGCLEHASTAPQADTQHTARFPPVEKRSQPEGHLHQGYPRTSHPRIRGVRAPARARPNLLCS